MAIPRTVGRSAAAASASVAASAGSRSGTKSGAGQVTFGIVDNFERASLGSNWEIAYPTGGDAAQVQILGSSDLGMAAGNQAFFLVDWIANTFSADQYAEAVISPEVPTSPAWAHQPYVRRNFGVSPAPRYGFGYSNDPNQPTEYQRWYFKYDGVATPDTRYFGLTAVDTVNVPQPGDTLRVEIVGYTLRGYWRPVATGTWQLMTEATDTDATKIANGRPGLCARLADGNSSLATTTKVWESFGAGNM